MSPESTSPSWPPIHRRLTLPGFRLGHAGDDLTGVTVILCPEGARAAAEVFGSATGTRQFDSMVLPQHVATRAHAFVLSGGSAFGLDAARPVSRWLVENGHGFATGLGPVPLVPTAILFDGSVMEAGRPEAAGRHPALAERALAEALEGDAEREVPVGRVGAGTGASVGKARGIERAMYGGFGFAAATLPDGGPTVAAAVAVNAFGDVRDLEGRPVAGVRRAPDSRELDPSPHLLAPPPPDQPHPWEGNTTLAVVLTDADLSKVALHKVCRMAFGGLFRTLVPALSLYDGDLVAALALGDKPAHVHQVAVLAERLVAEAILTGVRAANPPDAPLTPPRLPGRP